MERACTDHRLPLEAQAKLRQVELQAAHLNDEQLRESLLAAWHGWQLERTLLMRAFASLGAEVQLNVRGYTPFEVAGIDG
jgi:hypothetical protein